MSHRIKLIDAHTHAFPDKLASRAVAVLSERSGIPYRHNGTFDGLCEYESTIGAERFLLLPIATKPEQTRACNAWAAEKQGQNGAVCFGSVHPASKNLRDELAEAAALGLPGIKLHPEYQDFYPDDEGVFRLYEEAVRHDLIIWFHAGEDVGFKPPAKGAPHRIAAAARRYPEGRFAAAHMGGYKMWDETAEVLPPLKNLWVDTSFAAHYMKPDRFLALTRSFGANRVMFGTDTPWADAQASLDAVRNSGLTEDELEWIFSKSVLTLLMRSFS